MQPAREDTIAAISTPLGTGGIGIVRISGPGALEIAERVFRPYNNRKKLSMLTGYSGMLGRVCDGQEDIDECIAYVYIAPKSYTGEDVVELSCHGGMWIIQKVLRLCLENGAVPAGPGEFTKRAFINGKLDLSQAEAVQGIIGARGEAAAKAALAARSGALSGEIREVAGMLTAVSAHLAAWADYPEEDIGDVKPEELLTSLKDVSFRIGKLLISYDKGRIIYEGVQTAIIGRPNVGKSTLMNLLAGHDRSIVTDIPGTTRDVIEDTVRVGDILLRLYDTAGIRPTGDSIEILGVEKSKNVMETAQLVLAVFDSSQELSDGDMEILERLKGKRCIAVINKVDLPKSIDIGKIDGFAEDIIFISAASGEGRDVLEKAILKCIGMNEFDSSAATLINERQRALVKSAEISVEEAVSALESGVTLDAVNVEIDGALDSLLSISGERASDKIIDEVFSRFCVGK